ncbi:MAG: TRAP transporter TatT component family protein [Thermoanaerobaculia bacterium]
MFRSAAALTLVLTALATSGCSVNSFVAAKVGNALAAGGSSWSSEDDPELVREALPFALKTMESLAAAAPKHAGLRLALCRGYVGYAGGFLEPEAEAIESQSFGGATALRLRAERLYVRALGYCRQALDLEFKGAGGELETATDAALARVAKSGVETLYWTGVAWGSAVSLGLDHPERIAQLPTVRAIFERALVLDEAFDRGSLHEAMIVFDSMPAMMGGSAEGARRHFERSIELSGGLRASPYVTWARTSAVARQERREFRETLGKALAIDPESSPPDRLLNLISQGRARTLLARIDDLFFVDESDTSPNPDIQPPPTAGEEAPDGQH